MNHFTTWMYSSILIGITSIYVAYCVTKNRKTSAGGFYKNNLQNQPSLGKNLKRQPNSEIEKVELSSNQTSVETQTNSRSRHNSSEEENPYLQPIKSFDNWEIVGKVKRLYIYPIDGASRFRVNRMHCSNFGCLELGYGSLLRDRSFVVYAMNPFSNSNLAILEDPKLRVIKVTQTDSLLHVSSPYEESVINIDAREIYKASTTDVYYGDGTIIKVHDCGDEISTFLTTLIKNPSDNEPRILRLGLYVTCPRGLKHHLKESTLMDKSKDNHALMSLLPMHSACTIVNEESVNCLRDEIGETDLTHDYFRPHIVITGKLPKYAEDKIKALKVGNAVLSNKLPCIQNINVNVNPNTGNPTLNGEPYQALLRTRLLSNMHPKYNAFVPVFGINMKVIYEGLITEGDAIYVQWDNDYHLME